MKNKIKEGSILQLELSNNEIVFGRVYPDFFIAVYDYKMAKNSNQIDIPMIIQQPILFYCCVYKDVIKKDFIAIGYKDLSGAEIEAMPPQFMQDKIDINKCWIFDLDGKEKMATPSECLGLERSSVWEAEGLIKRIEDHYGGRKNFTVEFQKPILSKDDPRYLAGPNLMWSEKDEKFYRAPPKS